jgi:hypothetical protein
VDVDVANSSTHQILLLDEAQSLLGAGQWRWRKLAQERENLDAIVQFAADQLAGDEKGASEPARPRVA